MHCKKKKEMVHTIKGIKFAAYLNVEKYLSQLEEGLFH